MFWIVVQSLCEYVFKATIKSITKVFVKDISKRALLPIFTERDVTGKEAKKKVSLSGDTV
jgi:hypothetical protein